MNEDSFFVVLPESKKSLEVCSWCDNALSHYVKRAVLITWLCL